MKITNPELEVVRFNADDVIATSLYYMSAADYNAANNTNFTSDYVEFEGTMVATETPGVWNIINPSGAKEAKNSDIAGLMSGGWVYLPDVGITIPSTVMRPIAEQAFNGYTDNGKMYTHGVTYFEQYWNQ